MFNFFHIVILLLFTYLSTLNAICHNGHYILLDKGKSIGKKIPHKKDLVKPITPWPDVKLEFPSGRADKQNSDDKNIPLCPTISQLTGKVVPLVASQWYDLGLKLLGDTSFNLLNIIAKNDNHDDVKCCTKMFTKWQEDQSSSASWDQLFSAIRATRLGKVASTLEHWQLLGK